jgi:hypothetical protein
VISTKRLPGLTNCSSHPGQPAESACDRQAICDPAVHRIG